MSMFGFFFYMFLYPIIIVMKIAGLLDISWWLVLTPIWFPVLFVMLAIVNLGLTVLLLALV